MMFLLLLLCSSTVVTQRLERLRRFPDTCDLKVDLGYTCHAMQIRYWYNPATSLCQTFGYGGCGGNANKFIWLEDCMETCTDCPVVDCPPEISCPFGFAQTDEGCNTCTCLNVPEGKSPLAVPEGNVPLDVPEGVTSCPTPMCANNPCPNGYEKNQLGCDTCECKGEEPEPCPFFNIVSCAQECEDEFDVEKNEAGCDICKCKRENTCPTVTCENLCPNGYKKSELGCDTCICKGEEPCPPINIELCAEACEEFCVEKDEAGCDICTCKRDPSCPTVMCENPCPNGYEKSELGCDTCICKGEDVAHNNKSTAACQHFDEDWWTGCSRMCNKPWNYEEVTDEAGCDTCIPMCPYRGRRNPCPNGYEKLNRRCDSCICMREGNWNIALGKRAYQISNWKNYDAGRAVDGNTNTNFAAGSCSKTEQEVNPWWAVDLGSVYNVLNVFGTYASRRESYDIIIGVTDHNPIESAPNREDLTVCVDKMDWIGEYICDAIGRYVFIINEGFKILTLCEIEVLGVPSCPTPMCANPCPNGYEKSELGCDTCVCKGKVVSQLHDNIALGKTAYQASIWENHDAGRAVDGNANGDFSAGSCSCTDREAKPWWAVDLGSVYNVASAVVTNNDGSLRFQLHHIRIGVTDDNPLEKPNMMRVTVCAYNATSIDGTEGFACDTRGRYVVIINERRGYLILCEVEVYGSRFTCSFPKCNNTCTDGYEKDDEGCETCKCKEQGSQFACSFLKCKNTCTIGYEKNDEGCETCKCKQQGTKNIALGRTAYHSNNRYQAGRAVDGDINNKVSGSSRDSCTITRQDVLWADNSWWAVDLGSVHPVASVVVSIYDKRPVYNRPHWIRIGVTNENPIKSAPDMKNLTVCVSGTGDGRFGDERSTTGRFPCVAVGRYVVIFNIPSRLALCEVEIYGVCSFLKCPINTCTDGYEKDDEGCETCKCKEQVAPQLNKNIALGKNAGWRTAPTLDQLYAQRISTGTCPFGFDEWSVDLGSVYKVSSVVVTNIFGYHRGYHTGELYEVRLRYNKTKSWVYDYTCAHKKSIDGTEVFTCDARARSVRIWNNILCEVEVYGTINIALGKTAYQSSNGNEAGKAVDGNINNIFSTGSCTSTLYQDNPWWAVDLGSVHDVASVFVTNSDWNNFGSKLSRMRIGLTDDNPIESTPNMKNLIVCARMDYAFENTQEFPCDARGRFVVIINEALQFLTLCEVDVYGPQFPCSFLKCNNTCTDGYQKDDEGCKTCKCKEQVVPQLHKNIALGKFAYQSSIWQKYDAGKAVDGHYNRDGQGFGTNSDDRGSCSYTHVEANPWWAVDLGSVYKVARVVVTNRHTSYDVEFQRIRIGVTNENPIKSAQKRVNGLTVCAGKDNSPVSTEEFPCDARGRYVVIINRLESNLVLCEVEVYGNINIALGKTAYQSSSRPKSEARKAVDGDRSVKWKKKNNGHKESWNFCSSTLYEVNPWWAVDLGYVHDVAIVVVTTRDWNYGGFRHAHIGVTYNNPLESTPHMKNLTICESKDTAIDGFEAGFACDARGRYVVIIYERKSFLTLCEVEVYGTQFPCSFLKCNNTCTGGYKKDYEGCETCKCKVRKNIALGKTAYQSSNGQNSDAGRSVDGNNNSNFAAGSCSNTEFETEPWWAVDLGSVHYVYSVVVTPVGFELEPIVIGVSDGIPIESAARSKPKWVTWVTLCSQKYEYIATMGGTEVFPCGARGRYVVIISDSSGLTLCEVEVYGSQFPCSFIKCNNTCTFGYEKDYEGCETCKCKVASQLPKNFALGKTAYQSSIYKNYDAGRAVDGNANGDLSAGSCSCTDLEADPWWAVDLGSVYQVIIVVITTGPYNQRIRIGVTDENPIESAPNLKSLTFRICASNAVRSNRDRFRCWAKGRYVVIIYEGRAANLVLCEVEVNAVEIENKSEKVSDALSTVKILPTQPIKEKHLATLSDTLDDIYEPPVNKEKNKPGEPAVDQPGTVESDGQVIQEDSFKMTMAKIGCIRQTFKAKIIEGVINFEGSMTLQACGAFCFKKGVLLVGALNGTTCFCAGGYDQLGEFTKLEDCDVRCRGNMSQICGAEHAYSVYWLETTALDPAVYSNVPDLHVHEKKVIPAETWITAMGTLTVGCVLLVGIVATVVYRVRTNSRTKEDTQQLEAGQE